MSLSFPSSAVSVGILKWACLDAFDASGQEHQPPQVCARFAGRISTQMMVVAHQKPMGKDDTSEGASGNRVPDLASKVKVASDHCPAHAENCSLNDPSRIKYGSWKFISSAD